MARPRSGLGLSPAAQKRLRAGTKKIERKYAPPPKKTKKDYSLGGFISGAIEDIPKLGKAIYKSAEEAAGATAEDVRKGRGLPGAAAFVAGLTPAYQAAHLAGLVPQVKGPWAYKKLPKAEQRAATGRLAEEMVRSLPAQAKLLVSPKAWYDDPLIQVFNVAALALPAGRVASVGRLSKTFREANPGMSALDANKAALVESYHPGFMKAHGVKGGLKPRVIKGKYGTATGRMPSRTPLGRAGQRAYDIASEQIDVARPGAPLSASRRAQSQARRLARQNVTREHAARQRLEEQIAQAVVPTRRGRFARALGAGGRVDPAVGAALVAALEGPKGMPVREAVKARIEALNSILEQNTALRPRQLEIEQLRKDRDALPEEETEARAAIDTEIGTKQAALDFDLGRNVPPVTGSPIRDAVHKTMVESIGKKRANEAIKVWDARARAASPEDPAAWYTTSIAGAQKMPLAQFAPEGMALYQRMVADQGGWYFPLQRALGEMGEGTMQLGQLLSTLRKRGISTEELRNSGLEDAATRSPNLVVTPAQVLGELGGGGYFRVFDPDVQITRHDPSVDRYSGYVTRYDPDAAPQLNSRDAAPGEYHEMVVRYPELPGTEAGQRHWGRPGNVYHVRYQVFPDEDGNRVMLIEEIQSDWASDVRRAKKKGQAGVSPSPMGPNRYLNNAVRQVLREADNQDVDYVVLVDGDTQALRNGATELGVDDGVTVDDGFDNGDYGEWVDDETGEPLTNEQITAKLRAQGEQGSFTRLYNKEIPGVFEKVGGAEARYLDDAYTGRHAAQVNQYDFTDYQGYVQTTDSAMPGTVFEMTPEVKAKIRQEQPLYRRNWEGVPQGATEFLADGRARVTMFEKADVSTWIHELAHVAVRDLDPDDLRTLEREIAEGRKFDEWTEADHEKYARQFEEYLRDGHAAPALRDVFAKIAQWMREVWRRTGGEAEGLAPETADVFDRMLGRRYQNTVVLNENEIRQVGEDIRDLERALREGDVDGMEEAAKALEKIALQAEEAGVTILTRDKTPEQTAAILEGLRERKNAVVEDYRRRGVLDYSEEARGYFPQFSQWEALGQPAIAPSRLAATGPTVGAPRVAAKTINRNRNRLIRYQTGEVLNDPTAVLYILRARLRLQETIKAREELWAIGDPIREGGTVDIDGPVAFVRNPAITPERMRTATEAVASLSREDYKRLQDRRRTIEDADQIDISGTREEMIHVPDDGQRPEWTFDEQNVRAVPLKVAQQRLGDVFNSGPRNKAQAILGLGNAFARAALIYGPLFGARYVARNWVQNAVLLALTQPSAFLKLASNRKLRKEHPELWDRINEEFGTIQAQALPEYYLRPQGRTQRMERRANQLSGQYGEFLGKGADVPLRAVSWRRHAEKYGFDTPEGYEKLLDDPDLAEIRNTISQRVREDMIDFDALSPYEKEVLTRYLFIWPFVRGATKWPFMFAREYPGRVGALALGTQASLQGEDERPLGQQLNAGNWDFAWLNPAGPALDNAQRLQAIGTRAATGNWPGLIEPAAGLLNPQLQLLIQGGGGGLPKDLPHKVASEFIPFFSTGEAALGGKGKMLEMAQKTFGLQTRPRSVIRKADKWMSDLDGGIKWANERGFDFPAPVKAQVEQMRAAYGDWAEVSSRAEWAKRDAGIDATDDKERAGLILQVMHEHYPDKYAEIQAEVQGATQQPLEDVIASGRFDNAVIYRKIYDEMFGLKSEIVDEMRDSGYKPES